jgi:hypothetical protein
MANAGQASIHHNLARALAATDFPTHLRRQCLRLALIKAAAPRAGLPATDNVATARSKITTQRGSLAG